MSISQGELRDWADARIAELEGVPAGGRHRLRRWLWASDYLFEQLRRHPEYLADIARPPTLPDLAPDRPDDWAATLRRFRHRQSLGQIAMDVDGAPVEQVYARTSAVARVCAEAATAAAWGELIERHGAPRRRDGQHQGLQIFALGKLGGGELNFSSDIDLVFAFAEGGQTDGPRPLDHEPFFQRLGQRVIQLLGEVGPEGFAFRVDMRLRPFGKAGRLALSAAAMEQYYQRDGRDWERYAWIKARPLAGDRAGALELLNTLRPFIYRRYLDYTAFEGLREMKALIDAEVQRRDLADHVKLGPGGIREIEFIVQLQQLIRGGRDPALRTSGLLPALDTLQRTGLLQTRVAQRLRAAYRFLRRLENRLQMLRDEQVHELPEDGFSRARLAIGLGFSDWSALQETLSRHRATVSEEFARVFVARERRVGRSDSVLRRYWLQVETDPAPGLLADGGFEDVEPLNTLLQQLARHSAGAMAARARERLDRLMPEVLTAAAASERPDRTLQRLLSLLQSVLRRPAYLALLDEQPAALQRLVQVMGRSALLAERVTLHPILLDDLLDARAGSGGADPEHLRQELDAIRRRSAGDTEQALQAMNELKQSLAFRIGLATLFRQQPAPQSAAELAQLAQALVETLLPLAIADLAPAHGVLPGRAEDAGLAVIGYGSLGGEELGFGSDLDLVFLYDAEAGGSSSDGPRPLDAARYQMRVVQKLLALLSTLTAAGRLYEVDLRLRPDGAKGLLLTSLQSFAQYQRERAWTWEHQALVRARPVAGARSVIRGFESIRGEVLQRRRDPATLREEVARMRQRMRGELDRGRGGLFDLKQGPGGLVDLEFALQAAVLLHAADQPVLRERRATPALIRALRRVGLIDPPLLDALMSAHGALLQRALDCTLDARPRLVPEDATLATACRAVLDLWDRLELPSTQRPVGPPASTP